jgi:hypothetical protein
MAALSAMQMETLVNEAEATKAKVGWRRELRVRECATHTDG